MFVAYFLTFMFFLLSKSAGKISKVNINISLLLLILYVGLGGWRRILPPPPTHPLLLFDLKFRHNKWARLLIFRHLQVDKKPA